MDGMLRTSNTRTAGRNQSASDGFHESALARLGPDYADVERTSSRVAPLFDQTRQRALDAKASRDVIRRAERQDDQRDGPPAIPPAVTRRSVSPREPGRGPSPSS